MENELWSPIVGFDKFEISSWGRIRNKYTENIYTPYVRKDGYNQVIIQANGQTRLNPTTRTIHSLVCEAFHTRPIWATQVNHIDGNKSNNRSDNLEWVTAKSNILHAHKTGLISWAYLIEVYDLVNKTVDQYPSNSRFAEKFGLSQNQAATVLRNRNKGTYLNRYKITVLTLLGKRRKDSSDVCAFSFIDNSIYRCATIAGLSVLVGLSNNLVIKALKTGKAVDGICVWYADDKQAIDRVIAIPQEEITASIVSRNNRFTTNDFTYQLKNYTTGEIKECSSQKEIAGVIGVPLDTVVKHIQHRRGYLLLGWYIRHGYDKNPLPSFNKDQIELSKLSTGRPKRPFKLVTVTGNTTYWKSAHSLAVAWNKASSVIDRWVKENTIPGHQVIFL